MGKDLNFILGCFPQCVDEDKSLYASELSLFPTQWGYNDSSTYFASSWRRNEILCGKDVFMSWKPMFPCRVSLVKVFKTLMWREVLFSETLVWEPSLCRGLKYLRWFASILESPRSSLTHPRDVMLMTWSPQTHAELRGSPLFFCFLQKALRVRIIGFSILPSH